MWGATLWCSGACNQPHTRCCCTRYKVKNLFFFLFWFPRCCCWFCCVFFGPFWLIAGSDRQATCLDFHLDLCHDSTLPLSHSRSRCLSLSRLGFADFKPNSSWFWARQADIKESNRTSIIFQFVCFALISPSLLNSNDIYLVQVQRQSLKIVKILVQPVVFKAMLHSASVPAPNLLLNCRCDSWAKRQSKWKYKHKNGLEIG